ncbi:MAG: GTPase Era [Epsilonproteobacteria bacterium]|nr:GTPase Era [Campylobacterota bacterium]
MSEETKAGFVSIVGRPNAGKSSLVNWLLGEKLSMVSKKANATRKRSTAIVMHKNAQIILVDTPGIHEKERLLNQFMLEEALKAIGDCDLILFLSPVTDSLEHYEKFIKLNKKNTPHIVLLTKIDRVKNEQVLKKLEEFKKYQDKFLSIVPISIKNESYREYLLDEIVKYLPKHPYLYDPEFITTSHFRDIYKEFILEAIFEKTSEEIPYSTDVIIDKIEEGEKLEKVYATIVTESKSQKMILIGKGGETIKRIGKYARVLMENLSGKKIYLELFVTVKPGWSKNKKTLSKLGYDF